MKTHKIGTVISLAIALVAFPSGFLYAQKKKRAAKTPGASQPANQK